MTDLLKNYSCEEPTDSSRVAVLQGDYALQNASTRSHCSSESLYSICQTSSRERWKKKGAAGGETRLATSQVSSHLTAWSCLHQVCTATAPCLGLEGKGVCSKRRERRQGLCAGRPSCRLGLSKGQGSQEASVQAGRLD